MSHREEELLAEIEQLKEANRRHERWCGCPCVYTTPCDPWCTCVKGHSSRGCLRCCTYGSVEQRRAKAERLAAVIDGGVKEKETED